MFTRNSTKSPCRTAREIFKESGINASAAIRTIQSYLGRFEFPGLISACLFLSCVTLVSAIKTTIIN